jgi:hypothetical protein
MPMAGFGRAAPLRIEETGYPTGPGRSDAGQDGALDALVRTAQAYQGTYGITDFRSFGLRDNNSHGPDLQSFFGLLRDDSSPKPAFATYRRLIARFGARRAGQPRSLARSTSPSSSTIRSSTGMSTGSGWTVWW